MSITLRRLQTARGIRFYATLTANGRPLASTLPVNDRNAAIRALTVLRVQAGL